MLSLEAIFWIFLIFFGMIGALRGWAKELVASAGLVLSLFALKTFGPPLLNILGLADVAANPVDPAQLFRRQFWILTSIHLFIAFISYQGPTLSTNVGARLRRSDSVQDKLLGAIFGLLNGWLIVGTIFSFLEFRVQRVPINDNALGFVRLITNEQYPFSLETISRPVDALTILMFQYLPLGLFSGSQLLLPLIMVALFLVILIVIV